MKNFCNAKKSNKTPNGVKKIHLLITAGPTYEPIDPVRIITNRSTGQIGYEIAKEALKRKYKVTLISGPTHLVAPPKARFIMVESALDMKEAVLKEFVKRIDCLIMAAAVSDYRTKQFYGFKIKRKKTLSLNLLRNPDILKSLPKRKGVLRIGFALETKSLLRNARKKLKEKRLDLIIANKIDKRNTPFGGGKKDFVFIEKKGKTIYFKNTTKRRIAKAIINFTERMIDGPVQ